MEAINIAVQSVDQLFWSGWLSSKIFLRNFKILLCKPIKLKIVLHAQEIELGKIKQPNDGDMAKDLNPV